MRVVVYILILFCISFIFYFLRIHLVSRLGILVSDLLPYLIITVGGGYITFLSSTGSEDSISSTTNIIESSDSLLSHSNFGAPNPEPGDNLLSHFGAQYPNPDRDGGEIQLYARIRILENRLIDRLPPQLNFGEYEGSVRDNLNQAINIAHYQSALANEVFDITILELKANLQDLLFNQLIKEPDQRLTEICRESPFNEKDIRTEALEFLEDKIETLNLENPRSHTDKVLLKATLEYWLQHLQQNGHASILYTGFVSHFRGM